jgi:hypothetical protein
MSDEIMNAIGGKQFAFAGKPLADFELRPE